MLVYVKMIEGINNAATRKYKHNEESFPNNMIHV